MSDLADQLNFIIISRQSWEKRLGSNIRDMAYALSQKHRVLFVNEPMDWSLHLPVGKSGRLRERAAFRKYHQGQHLISIQPNLWVLCPRVLSGSFNWLPDSVLYDWLNQFNTYRITQEIKRVIRQLGWSSFVILNDNDMLRGVHLKELLAPAFYVYYQRDNLLAVDYWRRHGARLEPILMRKANLIANNSLYLARQAARHNPNSIDIGQGCDLQLFQLESVTELPSDLAAIPGPRIGYAGALTTIRLDLTLLKTLADQRPDWQLILIGAPDEAFRNDDMNALPNVHFLGAKAPHQIPAYLAGMDVLINPQALNAVTIGNYPRKIDEYLAMGKPVVAVRTETMSLFADHVFLADTSQEFIAGIADALAGKAPSTPAERIAFAHQHTWEDSINRLLTAIRQPQTDFYSTSSL